MKASCGAASSVTIDGCRKIIDQEIIVRDRLRCGLRLMMATMHRLYGLWTEQGDKYKILIKPRRTAAVHTLVAAFFYLFRRFFQGVRLSCTFSRTRNTNSLIYFIYLKLIPLLWSLCRRRHEVPKSGFEIHNRASADVHLIKCTSYRCPSIRSSCLI